MKGIKLIRKRFLKTGLNFREFLRFMEQVLGAGRRPWSLFSSFRTTSLKSLSTSSWRRSESLITPDSIKHSLYERKGKMMSIVRFCTPSSSLERYAEVCCMLCRKGLKEKRRRNCPQLFVSTNHNMMHLLYFL